MTTNAAVTAALRLAADTIEGLPGIPPVSVNVWNGPTLTLSLCVEGDDQHARTVAVDTIAALLGITKAMSTGPTDYGTGQLNGDTYLHVWTRHDRRVEKVTP